MNVCERSGSEAGTSLMNTNYPFATLLVVVVDKISAERFRMVEETPGKIRNGRTKSLRIYTQNCNLQTFWQLTPEI